MDVNIVRCYLTFSNLSSLKIVTPRGRLELPMCVAQPVFKTGALTAGLPRHDSAKWLALLINIAYIETFNLN